MAQDQACMSDGPHFGMVSSSKVVPAQKTLLCVFFSCRFSHQPGFVPPRGTTISEQGSLDSIRPHLISHSALSTAGSAPVSNSASEHMLGFTANSLKSRTQALSLRPNASFDLGQTKYRHSPALSALGSPHQQHPYCATVPAPALPVACAEHNCQAMMDMFCFFSIR